MQTAFGSTELPTSGFSSRKVVLVFICKISVFGVTSDEPVQECFQFGVGEIFGVEGNELPILLRSCAQDAPKVHIADVLFDTPIGPEDRTDKSSLDLACCGNEAERTCSILLAHEFLQLAALDGRTREEREGFGLSGLAEDWYGILPMEGKSEVLNLLRSGMFGVKRDDVLV
ncbi:MAG: hypothetical protein WCE44_06695 [Candidatus Velthaea sp.]